MDRSTKLENKEEELAVPDAGNAGTVECFERGRVESQGEETESEVTYSISERSNIICKSRMASRVEGRTNMPQETVRLSE